MPENNISLANRGPYSQVWMGAWMPPMPPTAASGSRKNASSLQKMRSHGNTKRWPPPMQPPCTAAMVGFMRLRTKSSSSHSVMRSASDGASRCEPSSSAPAQKCLPVARSTSTPRVGVA